MPSYTFLTGSPAMNGCAGLGWSVIAGEGVIESGLSRSRPQHGDPVKSRLWSQGPQRSDDRIIVWSRRKASTMGIYVLQVAHGALRGNRLPVAGVGRWLASYVFRAELVLSLGHDLAAAVRDSIVRRASRSGAARIHVPAMSDAWLRMHETEYDKRRAEL